MERSFFLYTLVFVLSFSGGYFLHDVLPTTHTSEKPHAMMHEDNERVHDNAQHQLHTHTHEALEIDAHERLPEVVLTLHEDKKSGWNAHIETRDFTFAPEHASETHVEGEGHAHIYVDGVKINRVYGAWYHLGTLEPGARTVSVTLSSNDHRELTHHGRPISDEVVIEVREEL